MTPAHKITPTNPPQFPCWLYGYSRYADRKRSWFKAPSEEHYSYPHDTHWSPDQPAAPDAVPHENGPDQNTTVAKTVQPASIPQWVVDAAAEIINRPSWSALTEYDIAAIIARHARNT